MKIINSSQEDDVVSLYKKELSGPLISKKLALSRSQIYDALKRKNIIMRTAEQRFRNSPLSFSYSDNLSEEDMKLMIAGTMLYLGEGAKTGNTVDLVNSDPKILRIFISYLRKIFKIDEAKIRLYLYCFSDQNQKVLIDFWCKTLDVNKRNFTAPYVRKKESKRTRITRWGVLHIRYNDKRLLEKILSLCSSIADDLLLHGQILKWPTRADCQKAAYEGNFIVNYSG